MEPTSRSIPGRDSIQGASHSRPTSNGASGHVTRIDPSVTLGQFAFAPATQTTVVTTTTTTTTKFPPFAMRPPRPLDIRYYPLAAASTPASLKSIRFTVEGKQVLFHEPDDTHLALEQLGAEYSMLQHANSATRGAQSLDSWGGGDLSRSPQLFPAGSSAAPDRPVSPESITEIDEIEDTSPSSKPSRRALLEARRENPKNTKRSDSLQHARLRNVQISSPLTPEAGPSSSIHHRRPDAAEDTAELLVSPGKQQQRTPHSLQSRPVLLQNRLQSNLQHQHAPSLAYEPGARAGSSKGRYIESQLHLENSVPAPPTNRDDTPAFPGPSSRRTMTSIPSRLNVIDGSNVQDGSLPSPSLSPVTAAATSQNAGYFADIDSNSEMASQHDNDVSENDIEPVTTRVRFASFTNSAKIGQLERFQSNFTGSSITDIPAMLDYFEAIPDELKSYVMHQLLRRCPKNTLHVVADAVNPALRCDFLSMLPTELGLNIVRFLDLQSLCKASQVSKKWRQMINGDEKAWKEILDADGLNLAENELQRAIVEGWGWQDPYGRAEYEKDISGAGPSRSGSDEQASTPSPSSAVPSRSSAVGLRRSKRKAASAMFKSRKQIKRSDALRADDLESVGWMNHLSITEGPYNAANAAILAVPHPNIGLPSLKGLHLYKSLYRRHHLIRRNWLYDDTKPHHIAFRAHDNHVVTCLQFDTDKILTGSDDNNINVYDTKTGALRAKLEGHEGGVWALQYEGNTLVSGSTDRSVRVWDIERGLETQVFRGHTSTVRCLQILMPTKVGENAEGKPIMMPKQPLIITGSRDSNLRVWNLPRPGDPKFIQSDDEEPCPYFVRALSGHQHSVRAIAAHADTLVSGSYDCTIRVWKISTGETIHRLQGHTAKVYSVVLDHDRNRCISGSMDNMVKIWSLDTGSILHTLDGHSSLVGLLDLNCDRLVSAAADSTLRIWDPENGQCKATLSAHTGAITCFQHDGQKVISGSDRTLKMWNIKTGECIKDLLSELSGVWQVKFNERRCVAAVQRDNMTYIEVLDFGAARDGVPESKRGRRTVVDVDGYEVFDEETGYLDLDGNADV